MQAGFAAGDAVVAVWIKIGFVLLVGSDQRIGHFRSILEMHVVVAHAVDQQVIAFQPVGKIDRRIVAVPLRIFRFRAHVALRVNRIVPLPVGDGRYGDGAFKHAVSFQQAERRHVPAVAPAKNANAPRIGVFQAANVFCAFDLIHGFVFAQLQVGHFFERLSPAARAAVVNASD